MNECKERERMGEASSCTCSSTCVVQSNLLSTLKGTPNLYLSEVLTISTG